MKNLIPFILDWVLRGGFLAVAVSLVCFVGGINENVQLVLVKLCWLTGAIAALLALASGLRQDRLSAYAREAMEIIIAREIEEQEYEAFVNITKDYLNSFFSKKAKPLYYSQDILKYLEANRTKDTYRNLVLSELSKHETTIYEEFITVLSNKDFETAARGMQLLRDACPRNGEYKKAFDRLRDKSKLIIIMEQNGLAKVSPLIKIFQEIFTKEIKTESF